MRKTKLLLRAGEWMLAVLAVSLSGCTASGGGGGGGNGGIVTPSIQVLSAPSGPVGASITITGSNFGATQGSSTVTFNGTAATSVESWNAANITVLVPAGATTGNVVVTIPEVTNKGVPEQVASNGVMFTVTAGAAPSITSVTPNSGPVGATVVVTGSNFGTSPGTGGVSFTAASAPAPLISWTATSISVTVPSGAITGFVTVLTSSGVLSNAVSFTVTTGPSVTSLTPNSGPIGTSVVISGLNFGASQGSSSVTFNGISAGTASAWSATSITAKVPTGAATGTVVVTVAGVASNTNVAFTVTTAPSITGLTPNTGPIGTSVVIAGANFAASQGSSTVTFNGISAGTASAWSATSITVTVPAGATTGSVVVTVAGLVSNNNVAFTVSTGPGITSLTPNSGPIGASVVIAGANFGPSQGSSTVTFNGVSAGTASAWSATSITVTVPAGATSGAVVVTVVGVASNNNVTFTVIATGCPLPLLGNESLLSGIYTALLNGWADSPVSVTQAAAAFQANGTSGSINSGEVDTGTVAIGVVQGVPLHQAFTGCFNLGADQRGSMIWNSATESFRLAFAVRADGSQGRFVEFDDENPSTTPGDRGAGFFEKQVPVTASNAPVAFGFTGYTPNGGNTDYRRSAAIGVISNIIFGGTASNGTEDFAHANGAGAQTNADSIAFTATFTSYDPLGRGTAQFGFTNFPGTCTTSPCPLTLNFAYYLGGTTSSPSHIFLQSTDTPDNVGHNLQNGEAIPQSGGPYSNSSVSTAVLQMTGADLSSAHAFTDTAVGLITNNSGAVTFNLDQVRDGGAILNGAHGVPNGSISISANGMGSITIGNSTAYSSAPAPFSVAMYGTNAGFIMEGTQASVPSPSTVLLGDFGPQTVPAGGFLNTTFSGLYAIGDDHPASTSSQNSAGSVATPSPQTSPASFSGKQDNSAGAPCLTNCLAADQAVTATYSIDGLGRITLAVTGGGTMPIGWLQDNKNVDVLSDPSSVSCTIFKLIQ